MLDRVTPALPDGVVVQVVASIVPQFVARNPTTTVLEVVGESGRPFLRISRAGVLADVGARDWMASNSPAGATSAADGPVRWVRVERGDSWGWFDHRLHPAGLTVEGTEQRTLADWGVELRYGAAEHDVRGRIEQRPVLGTFVVEADPAPAGLTVQPLQGRLPGLFLTIGTDEVTVLGTDDRPFLIFRGGAVLADPTSPSWSADQQARGSLRPGRGPGLVQLAAGRSHAWLDPRLSYPELLPPEAVLDAAEPAVVHRWEVPLRVGGEPAALTGVVRWVPSETAQPERGDGGPSPLIWIGATTATAAVVLAGATLVRRRREESAPPTSKG